MLGERCVVRFVLKQEWATCAHLGAVNKRPLADAHILPAFSEVEHPEDEPVFTLTDASLISYLSHVTLQFLSILLIRPKVIPEASPPAPVLHPLFALGIHPTSLFRHIPRLQSEAVSDISQTGIIFHV
jgi:hypothetical protein